MKNQFFHFNSLGIAARHALLVPPALTVWNQIKNNNEVIWGTPAFLKLILYIANFPSFWLRLCLTVKRWQNAPNAQMLLCPQKGGIVKVQKGGIVKGRLEFLLNTICFVEAWPPLSKALKDMFWKECTCGKGSLGRNALEYRDQGLTLQAPTDQGQSEITRFIEEIIDPNNLSPCWLVC